MQGRRGEAKIKQQKTESILKEIIPEALASLSDERLHGLVVTNVVCSRGRSDAKVYFDPVHLKTYYKKQFGYKKGDLPKTEELSNKVLTLPIYPGLKKEEINYIAESIKNVFEGK